MIKWYQLDSPAFHCYLFPEEAGNTDKATGMESGPHSGAMKLNDVHGICRHLLVIFRDISLKDQKLLVLGTYENRWEQ